MLGQLFVSWNKLFFFGFFRNLKKNMSISPNQPILAQKLQVSGWPMSLNVAKWNQMWLPQEKNKVQERPSQSLSRIVWHSTPQTCVRRRSPHSLTDLEHFCRDEWADFTKSRCAILIHSYPKSPRPVITCNKMCFIFPPYTQLDF